MPEYIIVSWRDIPAQIIVQSGRKKEKRKLSERFEKAIDACAMRIDAKDTDTYLAQWRKSAPISCDCNDIKEHADLLLAQWEKNYDIQKLKDLINNEGFCKE